MRFAVLRFFVGKTNVPNPKMREARTQPPGSERERIPMKPRPRLFAALLIVFATWVIILVAMYFTMVRSRQPRRPAGAPSQAEAAAAAEKTVHLVR